MLRLRALQVFNWGYAPFQVPLPIGDVTLLQGRNGSGKTTYLSAIALLLGVRHLPKRQSYDKFVYPGQDWGFIRAVADNTSLPNGRRPFDSILPTLEESITLACLLERRQGGWQRSYYIVPGADFRPGPDTEVRKEYQFKHEEYRRTLAHVGVRDALLNLLEFGLYGLRDTARDPASRFQFFLKLVGNEEIQQEYQNAREVWWKQREQTIHLDERLRKEEADLTRMEETLKILRRRRELKAQVERDRLFAEHAHVRALRNQLNEQEAVCQGTIQTIADLQRRKAAHEQEWARFEQHHADWEANYFIWRQQRDDAEQAFRTADTEANRADTLATQQQQKVDALSALSELSMDEARAGRDSASLARDTAHARWAELHQQLQEARREKTELELDRTPLPRDVEAFLQRLRQESIAHLLVADAVEILDADWMAAVEGSLGGERYTVIVPDETQRVRTQQIAETMRYRYWVSPSNPRLNGKPVESSLWEMVSVADECARGWVHARLARIRRVSSVQEGHRYASTGAVTITPQAYSQELRGGRSLHPREIVCGRLARQARLKSTKEVIERLEADVQRAQEEKANAEQALEHAGEILRQANARQNLPAELERLEHYTQDARTKRQVNDTAQASYLALKAQEDEWNQRRDEITAWRTRLETRARELEERLAEENKKKEEAAGRIHQLERQLHQLEPMLPSLDDTLQAMFDSDHHLATEHYRERANKAEAELQQLPLLDYEDVPEELYEKQKSTVSFLRQEVDQMRAREQEARAVFDHALNDFRQHVQELFGQGMHRQFRSLCQRAGAQGDIYVMNDGEDHWGLDVKVGFDGKPRQPLESANLSQGQEVMTGLFLVLAALNTVGATPILLLDELMSTLDEVNAPLVLRSLKMAQAQCLVATPHIRPQADVIADVVWGFQPMSETAMFAPPVAVLVRRSDV